MKVELLKNLNGIFIVKFNSEIRNLKLVDLLIDLSKENDGSEIYSRGRILIYKHERNSFMSDFTLPRSVTLRYVISKEKNDIMVSSQKIGEFGHDYFDQIKNIRNLFKNQTDITDGQYLVFK